MDTNNISSKLKNTMLASAVFSVIGIGYILFNLFHLIPLGETVPILHNLINLLLLAITLNYLFVGYKKPHGNMLRVAFFLFAMGIVFQNELEYFGQDSVNIASNTASAVAGLMIAYAAGRLDKLEKNTNVLLAAGILLLIHFLIQLMNSDFVLGMVLNRCTPMIVLAGLGAAYAARFEAHKAAGQN